MLYFLSWILSLILIKARIRRRVSGRDNIPDKGSFILASNHDSYMDPAVLGTAVKCSKWFYFLAKRELFEHPFWGWYLRQIHALPLDRSEADPSAIKRVLKLLKSGRPLILFPEGTRSRGQGLRPAKPGVGFIVAKARVPVVPVYIEGSYRAMPEGWSSVKRGDVNVFIGKPLYFDGEYRTKEAYLAISDHIMKEIASLKEANGGKTC